MNKSLNEIYGYGLLEFLTVLVLFNENFGINNPYYKDNIIKGSIIISNDCLFEINSKSELYSHILENFLDQKGKIKPVKFKSLSNDSPIKENEHFKIGFYQPGWDLILPSLVHKYFKKGKIKFIKEGIQIKKNLLTTDWNIIKTNLNFRDRIVGVWAGKIRGQKGIHWDNISELLIWFLGKFSAEFQNNFGDPDSQILKKQFQRKKENADILFELLRRICFPIYQKKPYWSFWFRNDYILWISRKIFSKNNYDWLKENTKSNFHSKTTKEFWKNKNKIGLNELKKCFDFYYINNFSYVPDIVFPNGEYI